MEMTEQLYTNFVYLWARVMILVRLCGSHIQAELTVLL